MIFRNSTISTNTLLFKMSYIPTTLTVTRRIKNQIYYNFYIQFLHSESLHDDKIKKDKSINQYMNKDFDSFESHSLTNHHEQQIKSFPPKLVPYLNLNLHIVPSL